MTASELVHLTVFRRIRPSQVATPNWKAEYGENRTLRLEQGKGCKALPIATTKSSAPA
jgi:hypothetical protein